MEFEPREETDVLGGILVQCRNDKDLSAFAKCIESIAVAFNARGFPVMVADITNPVNAVGFFKDIEERARSSKEVRPRSGAKKPRK
jgi:hypothetical protein